MTFRRQPLSVFTIALVIFLVASVAPVLYMLTAFLAGSFRNPSTVSSILIDFRQLVLLKRSISIGFYATLVALGFGLPAGIALAAKDLPFRKLLQLLVLMPLLIPPYVMAGAWIHLLNPTGAFNQLLQYFFGPSVKLSAFSQAGCVWSLGISYFPVIAIMLAAGLSKVDRSLQDVALLSTGRWGTFRHSTCVQVLPHLVASICLVMIFVLGRYGVPSLLGVNTYPVEIFAQFSAFYNEDAAVATALPLIILVVILILLQRRLMANRTYTSIAASSDAQSPMGLGNLKYYAAVLLLILFLVTTGLPFVSVLRYTRDLTNIWSSLTRFSDSIVTTSVLALMTAVVSTFIALPIGYFLAYSKGRFSRLLDVICWLPIAVPGTIVGLGLIKLTNLMPAFRSIDSFGLLLLLAYVGMFSAFSIRIFQVAYKQMDPNISEIAILDCSRWHQRIVRIDLPIHAGPILASIIIVFVLVLGELSATVLLVPPGKSTLSVTIDNLLHYGANVQASVLCLTEAVLVLILAWMGLLLWWSISGKEL